jgi:hypothetical protein
MGLGILITPKKKGVEPEPPAPDEDDGESESQYASAGKAIRHAIADKDDEGLGRAVCDLYDYHSSARAEGDDDGDKSSPDLASILSSKKKGK